MKVLVFSPYGNWCPTFEYELEITQDHLDAGDDVSMAVCNAALPTCDVNPHHQAKLCAHCVGKRLFGLARLSKPVRQLPIPSMTRADWWAARELPRRFTSLDELRSFRLDRFDLGLAALSSVVTAIREPKPDLADDGVGRLLHQFVISAFAVYRSLLHLLDQEKFDRVYVLNGRLAILRAVLRACQSRNVECLTHERGWDLHHYSLHKNTMIHDLVYLERIILEAWESADPVSREKLASDYYLRRSLGEGFNWHSFVEAQAAGRLPEQWDPQCHNIVLYTSSDDELVALGEEWQGPLYEDQTTGVRQIAAAFASRPQAHLYVRVHPNLSGVNNSTTRALAQVSEPNVTIIPPDSAVCSYALLRNASKVITFSSRMAVEATFWEIPSILAGQGPHRNLGSTYNPANHEQLLHLLDQKLEPKDKLGALQYAYFFRTFGTRARYFELTGYCKGKYRSIELRETGLYAEMAEFIRQRPRLAKALSSLSSAVNQFRLGGHRV